MKVIVALLFRAVEDYYFELQVHARSMKTMENGQLSDLLTRVAS